MIAVCPSQGDRRHTSLWFTGTLSQYILIFTWFTREKLWTPDFGCIAPPLFLIKRPINPYKSRTRRSTQIQIPNKWPIFSSLSGSNFSKILSLPVLFPGERDKPCPCCSPASHGCGQAPNRELLARARGHGCLDFSGISSHGFRGCPNSWMLNENWGYP